MIDGYTRTCGLIGNPVEHTISPLIQNTLAEKSDFNLTYVPFHVNEGMLEDAVRGGFALNLLGMNVTVPYKNDVIPFLKDIDPLAKKIGAVNTLVRVENGYKGYNTDMPGLYRAMVSDGFEFDGKKIVILGAGGVARAVGVMLAEKDVEKIVLVNRTVEKAQIIADELNGYAGREVASVLALKDIDKLEGDGYIAIQATNVGMFPKVDEAVVEDESFYKKIVKGYDLVYNPANTKFMQLLKKQGKKAYNGLKMLLYQGIIAYELWTERKISDETADYIYDLMVETMNK